MIVQKTTTRFNSQRINRLDQFLTGYVNRGELPCASAVVGVGSEIIYRDKAGWQSLEERIPLSFDTIFFIMSMTKPIVAAAAMLLYEEAAFDLNTPVSQFMPEFENMNVVKSDPVSGKVELLPAQYPITFRHLFTHTSGIGYGSLKDDPADSMIQKQLSDSFIGGNSSSIRDFVRSLSQIPLAFEPGSSFRYGLNLDVLGAIIEIISGDRLGVFLKKRIFDPLGMVDTTFEPTPEQQKRLAVVYHKNEQAGKIEPFYVPVPLSKAIWGGGGLFSTLDDYSRFAMMLANGGILEDTRLLSPSTVSMFSTNYASKEALTEFIRTSPQINAGFGYSLGTAVLIDPAATGKFGNPGEYYWGGAYGTYFWVDPLEKLFAIFLTQLHPNWAYPIPWQFHQLVYQAILSNDMEE